MSCASNSARQSFGEDSDHAEFEMGTSEFNRPAMTQARPFPRVQTLNLTIPRLNADVTIQDISTQLELLREDKDQIERHRDQLLQDLLECEELRDRMAVQIKEIDQDKQLEEQNVYEAYEALDEIL